MSTRSCGNAQKVAASLDDGCPLCPRAGILRGGASGDPGSKSYLPRARGSPGLAEIGRLGDLPLPAKAGMNPAGQCPCRLPLGVAQPTRG